MSARSFPPHPADRRFYGSMCIAMTVAILGGFLDSYGPKVAGGVPVPAIIHLHAVVFTAWLAFLLVQTALVAQGRTAVHRRLGVAGVALALLMLGLGYRAAIVVTRLGHRGIPGVEFPDVAGFLLLNIASVTVFAALVVAGWIRRRDPQAHKRLMLVATAGALVGPGVSRLPLFSGHTALIAVPVLAFMLAGPAWDLVTRRRVHRVYIWSVALSLLALPPVVGPVSSTAAWRSIASWLLH